MSRTLTLLVGGLFALALSSAVFAQTNPSAQPTDSTPCSARPTAAARFECFQANRVFKTYYLAHTTQQNDANEILITLRNMLDPQARLYLVASQNAITVYAPPEEQAFTQKIIDDLDRPRKTYRLTFTLVESDGSKRISAKHFSLVVVAGQRTLLKQGSKVPIITSLYNENGQSPENMFQYLDVGTNLDATLDDSVSGSLRLKSKVEQSSVSDEHMSGALAAQPIVHQAVLEGTTLLTPGKPLTLGSMEVTGTTHRIDVEVVAEPLF